MIIELTILQIEDRIVTCQIDNGTIIDIAKRWFTDDIQEGDVIEINMNTSCDHLKGQ